MKTKLTKILTAVLILTVLLSLSGCELYNEVTKYLGEYERFGLPNLDLKSTMTSS